MDGYEAKELYYALIADLRPERRREAAERLGSSPDGSIKKLAAIGQEVAKVIHEGAAPETLDQIIKSLGTLPISDYWNGFAETTGQVLLLKASGEKGERGIALMEYGLRIIRMAQNAGFPLSDYSIELVKSVKKTEKLAELAGNIVRLNSSYRPKKQRLVFGKTEEKDEGLAGRKQKRAT